MSSFGGVGLSVGLPSDPYDFTVQEKEEHVSVSLTKPTREPLRLVHVTGVPPPMFYQ